MDLPLEVRILVYKRLFTGRRLRWEAVGSGQRSTNVAKPTAILLASKQAYDESKSIMLSTAQIDVSVMIRHCQTHLVAPLFDTSLIRHIHYSSNRLTDFTDALVTLVKDLSHLSSVTFDYGNGSGYHFSNSHCGDTALEKLEVGFIKDYPQRILGREPEDEPHYDDGDDPDNQIVFPAFMATRLIQAWEACKRSFILESQVQIYSEGHRTGVSSKF